MKEGGVNQYGNDVAGNGKRVVLSIENSSIFQSPIATKFLR